MATHLPGWMPFAVAVVSAGGGAMGLGDVRRSGTLTDETVVPLSVVRVCQESRRQGVCQVDAARSPVTTPSMAGCLHRPCQIVLLPG
jgi:hypothetical protein